MLPANAPHPGMLKRRGSSLMNITNRKGSDSPINLLKSPPVQREIPKKKQHRKSVKPKKTLAEALGALVPITPLRRRAFSPLDEDNLILSPACTPAAKQAVDEFLLLEQEMFANASPPKLNLNLNAAAETPLPKFSASLAAAGAQTPLPQTPLPPDPTQAMMQTPLPSTPIMSQLVQTPLPATPLARSASNQAQTPLPPTPVGVSMGLSGVVSKSSPLVRASSTRKSEKPMRMRIQAMRAARARAEEQQLYAMDAAAKARKAATMEASMMQQAAEAAEEDEAEAAMMALSLAAPSPEKIDGVESAATAAPPPSPLALTKAQDVLEEAVEEVDEPLPLGPSEVMLEISFAEEAKEDVRGEASILASSPAGKSFTFEHNDQEEAVVVAELVADIIAKAADLAMAVETETATETATETETEVVHADAVVAEADDLEDDGFVYVEDSGVPIPEFNPYEREGYAAKLEMHNMRVARVLAEEQELYEKDLEHALAEASAGPSPWQAPARAGRRAMQAMRAARMQEEEQDLYAKDGEAALAASAAADPNPWQHAERASRRDMQAMRAVRIQVEEETLEEATATTALEEAIAGPSPWMTEMTTARSNRSKMQAMRAERAHEEARNLYLAACRTSIKLHGRKVVRTVWL